VTLCLLGVLKPIDLVFEEHYPCKPKYSFEALLEFAVTTSDLKLLLFEKAEANFHSEALRFYALIIEWERASKSTEFVHLLETRYCVFTDINTLN